MIHSYVFSQKERRLVSQDVADDLLSVFLHDDGVQIWVDVCGETEERARTLLEGVFHFHPLAIEDCIRPSDRPKADEYGDYVFLVIHAVELDGPAADFRVKELNFFIGSNFLVTYHDEPVRSVQMTMERIAKSAAMVARAPDRLTYMILSLLLDNYAPLLAAFSEEIADVERILLEARGGDVFSQVIRLKSSLLRLNQICWPQREIISRLATREFKIIGPHMLPYYRDLHDQLVRITTQTETYRAALTDILQVHLNLQQTQINRVIKVLTVLATLAVPVLVVTSFYGMNINHWPNFDYTIGEAYGWFFSITGFLTLIVYLVLRQRGWW